MITLSIEQLVSAVTEADAFKLPDMSEGTAYLYNSVYRRLANGGTVKLSGLDFDAFEPEDVDSIKDLHAGVFEKNSYAADGIASILRTIAPVSKAVGYV
jgi:hypothetical protein